MTNLSEDFGKMSRLMSSGQAVSLLGKTVDISAGNTTIHGKVSEVSGGDYPQVYVNGKYYDYSQVTRIRE